MSTTKYIWDPVNDSYLVETDDTNNTIAVYTNEPKLYGRLISQRQASITYWHHFDSQYSTRQLTDSSEDITDSYVYDAWGISVDTAGTTNNPLRFRGELGYYQDSQINSLYVRARTYIPTRGRWSSCDPLGLLVSPNLYTYAQNEPLSRVDPSGLAPKKPKPPNKTGYGHFCGLGRIAKCVETGDSGCGKKYKPDPNNPDPIDKLDAACEIHDCCLKTVLELWCAKNCNVTFCKTLSALECVQMYPGVQNELEREQCEMMLATAKGAFCLPS